MRRRALLRDLDWATLLREVTEQGAVFAACAVRRPFCDQLAAELRDGPYKLLRGPGLAGDPDGRPIHMVGGPTGAPRTSIGVRVDTA